LRPSRCEQVPDRVADHVALVRVDAESPCALEEEIGLGLRALDVAALDDREAGADPERLERRVDLRAPPRRRDPVDDAALAKLPQQLDRSRQRATLGQQLTEELAVTALEGGDLGVVERPPALPGKRQ